MSVSTFPLVQNILESNVMRLGDVNRHPWTILERQVIPQLYENQNTLKTPNSVLVATLLLTNSQMEMYDLKPGGIWKVLHIKIFKHFFLESL